MQAAERDRGKLLSALQHAWPRSEQGDMLRTVALHIIEHGAIEMHGAHANYSEPMVRAGKRR